MNRFTEAIWLTTRGLVKAVSRFPLTVFCLGAATILVCYMISLHKDPGLLLQKLMFTSLLGAFMGVAAQFSCERWQRLMQMRVAVYIGAALLILGYYLILLPVPGINYAVRARTLVAVFAMFCAFIWVPSFRGKADFNSIALTHFKTAFTAILYAAVLSAGCSSIIAAIDVLLFRVNTDSYAYTMGVIWIFFANLYYLSLLPHFNSEEEVDQAYARHAASCPRSLEVLISYIAVPLVAAYSLVLLAYFIKILVTLKWPSGQLGPMILGYSAAGLLVFILASRLENRFATLYRLVFPKALILMVVMQLISVAIRLNAYGITESRYYVALFGVFSLVCGILLSFKPVGKNSVIALIAAGLAIFSVLPPLDAFTVSRSSQVARLEKMLQAEGVLADGKIVPRADVSMELRLETTSILNYLELRNYLQYLQWLPPGFKTHEQMKGTFGFDTAYEAMPGDARHFDAFFDFQKPLDISGYDVMINMNSYTRLEGPETPPVDFQVRNVKYKLSVERLSPQEVKVTVADQAGAELVSTGLYDFANSLTGVGNTPKQALEPVNLDVSKNGYRMRIVLQSVNITFGTGTDAGANYSFFVLFGAPSR
ncbi:MAG: hypothetical protein A4E53_02164 [Pelotomaculum sp. PtaB.Bin104]|nr:MAG: hypothetical protein A4E53_02164 [Pelotomaculum sp. PtaB.Bin104]